MLVAAQSPRISLSKHARWWSQRGSQAIVRKVGSVRNSASSAERNRRYSGRQVHQHHDLGDASLRDMAQSRQLRIIPHRACLNQPIKFMSKRQKACDTRSTSRLFGYDPKRGWRELLSAGKVEFNLHSWFSCSELQLHATRRSVIADLFNDRMNDLGRVAL
jgi:hypothetical protein